jgi:threonine dehydrogenase-like Zn-dependent dehydrogenase
MVDTCRAAVFLGDDTFEVREFRVPDPPPGGAVLQVEAVGLCGSDVAQFHGVQLIPGASAFPVVPGHETIGRVAKLAPGADLGVGEGDRVAVDEVLSVDPYRVYGYTDMTGEGEVGLWGGYGEWMQIFAGTRLHPMTDRRPAEEVTLFEPLANALNWVSVVGVQEGDTVVIQGPGHQGLAVLEAVLARRPAMVIQTGVAADGLRLDAARAIGAHHVIAVDVDDPVATVADLTGGAMADVVLDVASVVQTVPLAVDLVRVGGRVLLAGLKHFAPASLVTDLIVLKALALFGGSGYTPASMARAVEMLEAGEVRSDLVVGEVFGLDGIGEAMGLLARSDPTRDAVRVGLKHTPG